MLIFYSYFKYLPRVECSDRKIIISLAPRFENGHSFKSCNDTAIKFVQNASHMWPWKFKKSVTKKPFHREGIDDILIGGTLYLPPPNISIYIGSVKSKPPLFCFTTYLKPPLVNIDIFTRFRKIYGVNTKFGPYLSSGGAYIWMLISEGNSCEWVGGLYLGGLILGGLYLGFTVCN